MKSLLIIQGFRHFRIVFTYIFCFFIAVYSDAQRLPSDININVSSPTSLRLITCPNELTVYLPDDARAGYCSNLSQANSCDCKLTDSRNYNNGIRYNKGWGKLRIPLFFHRGGDNTMTTVEVKALIQGVNNIYNSSLVDYDGNTKISIPIEFFFAGDRYEPNIKKVGSTSCNPNYPITDSYVESLCGSNLYDKFINVFLVDAIDGEDDQGSCVREYYAGYGLPPSMGNFIHLVNKANLNDRSLQELNLAHELGHSLGLWHTFTSTAFSGNPDACRSQDGIWDTPYDIGNGSVTSIVNNLMNYNDYTTFGNVNITTIPKITQCQVAKIIDAKN
jgi:Pregnancy-associated plasma protein-A